jgi:hypothetical protein
MKNILTLIVIAPYAHAPNTRYCVSEVHISPFGIALVTCIVFRENTAILCSGFGSTIIRERRKYP